MREQRAPLNGGAFAFDYRYLLLSAAARTRSASCRYRSVRAS